jgi:hypothetical protein
MSNENRFDKIDAKLDKLDSRLDNVEKILAVNTRIVEEHERRSTTLENQLVKELTPVKAHVALVTNGFKAVVWVSIAIGGIIGVVKTLQELGVI